MLVPRKGDEFASVGTVAEIADRICLPGGGRAVALEGSTGAGSALRARRRRQPARRGRPHPDDQPVDGKTRELRARVSRRGRGAPRAPRRRRPHRRVRPLDHRAGRAGDHRGYSPDLTYDHKIELLEILDVSGAARARAPRASARAADGDAGPHASATTCAPAPRSSSASTSAQADGVDPEGARRGRRLDRRGVLQEDRRGRHAGRGTRAGRARARALRAHGRAVGREPR